MAFVDTYRKERMLGSIDDYRPWNSLDGRAAQHWKAIGRIIALPQPLLDGIDTFNFLEIMARCSFDMLHASYAYLLTKASNCVGVPAPIFYYNFNHSKIFGLEECMFER